MTSDPTPDAAADPAARAAETPSALVRTWRALDGAGRTVVAAGVVLALLVGLAAGGLLVGRPGRAVPTEGSVDAGFARDMQAHHGQAVELSVILRDRSDDPVLRAIALDILTAQQQQVGQMFAWLRVWGLPQSGEADPMAWMAGEHGHAGAGGALADMPGWVQPADLRRLEQADGVEAERIFLALMIDHHLGGVEMARYAVEHAQDAQVVRLAEGIVTAQEREVTVLRDLLDERGGPLPADA